jgi:hypothetical protein
MNVHIANPELGDVFETKNPSGGPSLHEIVIKEVQKMVCTALAQKEGDTFRSANIAEVGVFALWTQVMSLKEWRARCRKHGTIYLGKGKLNVA